MKILRTSITAFAIALCLFPNLQAQTNARSGIKSGGMNEMPSTLRTSMNVTVGKQTQGIAITLVENGCVILSPNQAFQVIEKTNSMTEISRAEFGDRVNAGKQSQGVNFGDRVNAGSRNGVVSSGAGLLGGAFPSASVVSAAVSSVSNMGGASSAAYAATGKMAWTIKDDATTFELPNNLADGEYELSFIMLKDTLKTQVRLGFSMANGVLKTKHDTVKNSISNVR